MARADPIVRACAALCAVIVALAFVLVAPATRAEGTPPARLEQLSAADRERARGLMDDGDEKMGRGDARGPSRTTPLLTRLSAFPRLGSRWAGHKPRSVCGSRHVTHVGAGLPLPAAHR